MANVNLSVKHRQRVDTSANWALINPILLKGEIGIDETTRLSKTGDGITVWNNLKYNLGGAHAHTNADLPVYPTTLPPTGAAGGDLSGSYPNPTVRNDSHTHDTQYYTKGQIDGSVTPSYGYARPNLGNPSVTEMALIDSEATNKLWFYNPDCLLFEQTIDGTNWTTLSISNDQKKLFVSGNSNAAIHIPRNAVNYRITVTNNGNYVFLNWLYLYMSTSGNHCAFLLERKAYGYETWDQVFSKTNGVSTWPGHVFIQHNEIAFASTYHNDKVRITFIPTWDPDNTNYISLYGMEWWGGYPSGKRTIYSWDYNQNVYFPANVTANSLIGNASTATELLTPRSINGVNFDGSANITVPANGGNADTVGGKSASDFLLQSDKINKYCHNFIATDWGSSLMITIPFSIHKINSGIYTYNVEMLVDGKYRGDTLGGMNININYDGNKNFVLTSSRAVNGRVMIIG